MSLLLKENVGHSWRRALDGCLAYLRMKREGAAARRVEHRSAYRPDIDGLRAVAVLSVVLYHAGLSSAGGGFVGVDIFFVISGFVIAKSLLGDLEKGQFSISAFYERRIRRIFPALFVTLVATWAISLILLPPAYFLDFSKSLVASAGFVSNLYFWKNSGYFANGADLRPLLHTWSLSVEEQYYIFAPIAFFVIYRYLGRRWLLALVPVALLSLALSIYAMKIGPTANFFLLPTRAWELLLGAVLALRPPPQLKWRWASEALALIGVGLILWTVFVYTEATPFPGLTALPPCIGTALLIYTGGGRTRTSLVLASPPLVGAGLLSYSLYLVHWPVISFLTFYTLRSPKLADVIPIVGLSLVLAYLSWRFVERPFRRMDFIPSRRAILSGGVAMIVAVAALGYAGVAGKGSPGRYAAADEVEKDPQGLWREGVCFLDNNPDIGRWNLEACTITKGGAERVLLWGDSYAAHYAPGIAAAADRIPYRVVQYTAAGCPPILSYSAYNRPNCAVFNRNALAIIDANQIRTVILSARWVDLQRRGLDGLSGTIETLRRRGVRTVVIGQSPMFTTDVQLIATRQNDRPGDSWEVSLDPDLNTKLRRMAGPGFIDPIGRLCQGEVCPFRKDGRLLFADEGHFSQLGSVIAVERYFPLVTPPAALGPANTIAPDRPRGAGK